MKKKVFLLISVCSIAILSAGCGLNAAANTNKNATVTSEAPATSNTAEAPIAESAPTRSTPSTSVQPMSPTDVALTADEAKAIALEQAGVSEADTSFLNVSFEYDDGFAEYQVEFLVDSTEYDIEVDANTGNIIGYDVESIFD